MYFQISTKDFQKQTGSFDIITVKEGIIYISANRKLATPFEQLDKLPTEIQEQLEKDLEINKEQKKEELESEREKAMNKDVEYKGYLIQAEQQDRELINEAVNLYSSIDMPNGSMQFITKDNQIVNFTTKDLVNIMALMGQNKAEAFIKCRLLKDKVEAAKTVSEIQAIKWDN